MPRTDIHRPAELNREDYELAGYFYQGSSEALARSYGPTERELYAKLRELGNPAAYDGNHAAKGTCDHCGAHFAHGAVFFHRPTGETITVGWVCADDNIGLPDDAARMRRLLEREARWDAQRRESQAMWIASDDRAEACIEYLDRKSREMSEYGDAMQAYNEQGGTGRMPQAPYGFRGGFLGSMIHSLARYGSLTPRQTEAVFGGIAREARWAEKQANREPETEPTTPLETGRREIEGEIVSAKFQMSDYGETMKMLVKQDDGNKVWGTVPGSVYEASLRMDRPGDDLRGRLVGLRVSFTAAVTRSNDDEHFGFFKRPTAARVVEAVAA